VPAKKYNSSIEPDPCPNLVVERGPGNRGVGSWVPTQKHRLLWEYLYSTRNAWKKWPSHVFIDPFSGPGRIQVEGEKVTREGGAVLAWRALADAAPFTQVLIGDLEPDRAYACAERLRAVGAPVTPFVGPADQTIKSMVAAVPSGSLCMAYIDPYNLELLSFSIIETLSKLKVDLAINFSTMDLQRNAELEFDPKRARFDGTAPGWRQNPKTLGASRQNVALEFFQYWCDLVRALGFEHSKEMPLVYNDQGQAIYRMVFFARDKLPNRIWSDVARGPNRSFQFDE
jgi:three-Cys-motif partner protein